MAVRILNTSTVESHRFGMRTNEVAGGHMTDGESRLSGGPRGPAAVEIRVAARLENLAVLRTVVGAVGTLSDLDFDAVADLRLAVDEACTRLIRSATPAATLVVVVDPHEEEVIVEASTTCDTYDVVTEGSFSWHVLSSLTDDVRTFHNGHDASPDCLVFGITLTTRRAGLGR
jgi:anti-sigma regulatory factor (Ser/Thr protein kinase)